MSSTREQVGAPEGQRECKPRSKSTSIKGRANTVGDHNNAQNVVVHIHSPTAQEALTDSERELITAYRSTSSEGRLTIQHVALLAASKRPRKAT